MKQFDKEFQSKLYKTIEDIENNSLVEVVAIIKAKSGNYYDSSLWIGFIFMSIIYAFLMFSPFDFPITLIFFLTLMSFVVGYFLAELISPLKYMMSSKKRLKKNTEIYGRAIFQKGGIRFTNDKIGVLIYVSLFEKTAVVIPDRGAETAVPDEDWQKIKVDFQSIFEKSDMASAFIEKLQKTKSIFAQYILPIENDINELPDDLDVIL